MKKLMIVDDHHIVREGIKGLIEKHSNYIITHTISSIGEMFLILESSMPDLLLLDLKLADGDGITAAIQLKRKYPMLKILILSGFIEPEMAAEAKCVGIEGYALKSVNFNKLLETITTILKGQTFYDEAVDIKMEEMLPKNLKNLSNQEKELIRLMALGMTNKEIADNMNIAEKTARNYTSRLFRKINVDNRSEAVGYYMRHCKIHTNRV